jgi:hypothetical protein
VFRNNNGNETEDAKTSVGSHDVKKNVRWYRGRDKRTNISSVALSGYEEQIGRYGS